MNNQKSRNGEIQDDNIQYGDDDPCAPDRHTTPMVILDKATWPSGEEVMAVVCWRWNVSAAKEIAAGKEPNSSLDVRHHRADLSQSPHMVDRERALSSDFDASEPPIVIRVRMKGTEVPVVLDGWNRVYRAYRAGVNLLPAYQLTPEEERSVRLDGAWELLDQ